MKKSIRETYLTENKIKRLQKNTTKKIVLLQKIKQMTQNVCTVVTIVDTPKKVGLAAKNI